MRYLCLFVALVVVAAGSGCASHHWSASYGKCARVYVPIPISHTMGPMEAMPVGSQVMPRQAMPRADSIAVPMHLALPAKTADVKATHAPACPE